jgi:hypothetical protein
MITAARPSLFCVRLLYATMTNTDVSIYRLTITYAQLQQQFGSRALDLSTAHPTAGTAITVVSGFHRATYPCNIDGFAFRLREDRWTWQDSVPYTAACHTIPGTSGSPVLGRGERDRRVRPGRMRTRGPRRRRGDAWPPRTQVVPRLVLAQLEATYRAGYAVTRPKAQPTLRVLVPTTEVNLRGWCQRSASTSHPGEPKAVVPSW